MLLLRRLINKPITRRFISTTNTTNTNTTNKELHEIKLQLEYNKFFITRIYYLNCFLAGVTAGHLTFSFIK